MNSLSSFDAVHWMLHERLQINRWAIWPCWVNYCNCWSVIAGVICWIISHSAAVAIGPECQMRCHYVFEAGKPMAELLLRWHSTDLFYIAHQSACRAQLRIQVQLRQEGAAVILDREFIATFSADTAGPYHTIGHEVSWRARFPLPDAPYRLELGVYDLENGASFHRHLDYIHRKPSPMGYDLSDLALWAGSVEIIGRDVPPQTSALTTQFQVSAQKRKTATLRTILYASSATQSQSDVQQFVSKYQQTTVAQLTIGTNAFTQSLPLSGLPPGDYLVEVYLFDQQQLLAEVTRPITLRWDGLKQVLANLPMAIEQMKYIASSQQRNNLLRITDPQAQKDAFISYWKQLNEQADEYPEAALERYYQRLNWANERYTTRQRPGWDSPRGKALILYGRPLDSAQVIASNGRRYQKWIYTEPTRIFYFPILTHPIASQRKQKLSDWL
jgi:GWxTD domain-containing protein